MFADARKRCRSDGFTVLELLVSLTILALLIALLPRALGLGDTLWQMSERQGRRQALGAFLDVVRDRLTDAQSSLAQGPEGVAVVFNGGRDGVAFLSHAASGPQRAGLYRFSVRAIDAGAGISELRLTQSPYVENAAQSENAASKSRNAQVRVTSAAFRYFGRRQGATDATWGDTWEETTTLPELVEISVIPWQGNSARVVETVELRLRQ